MPPKIKVDRDTILNAALEVIRDEGISAITAQRVSVELGSSVAPIFREFQTVEELRMAAAERISIYHAQYLKAYTTNDSDFLTYGLGYINFAKEYPYLFETIMQPGRTDMNERTSDQLAFVVQSLAAESALSFEEAKELFLNIWIYTHGVACLVYRGSLIFTEEQEKQMLITAYKAFLKNYKDH